MAEEKKQGMTPEELVADIRKHLGNEAVDLVTKLKLIDPTQLIYDPRVLAFRSAGTPGVPVSAIMYEIAQRTGVQLTETERDLIETLSERIRSMRSDKRTIAVRQQESRTVMRIVELQEALIGHLLEYFYMINTDPKTGALLPQEFRRRMRDWVHEVVVRHELPGMLETGRVGTGRYTEDSTATLSIVRLYGADTRKRWVTLAGPNEEARLRMLQDMEGHRPFMGVQPYLFRDSDPNSFLYVTQGFTVGGVEAAFNQVMDSMEVDPSLGTKPLMSVVHTGWPEVIRIAMYITQRLGEYLWSPEQLTDELINMWLGLVEWESEFYAIPDLVKFLVRVYQHDRDMFAEMARRLDLRTIHAVDLVSVLGHQVPEQTLTRLQHDQLDELTRMFLHTHHVFARQRHVDLINEARNPPHAGIIRAQMDLAVIDYALSRAHLVIPFVDGVEGLDGRITQEQVDRTVTSINVAEAMEVEMQGVNAEIAHIHAAVPEINSHFVVLPSAPPAMPAPAIPEPDPNLPEQYSAVKEDFCGQIEPIVASVPDETFSDLDQYDPSLDASSGSDSSEPESDPSGGGEVKPESEEFKLLSTSDLPEKSEETVDLSDPDAKPPPPPPRFRGRVPPIPIVASLEARESGMVIPDSVSEPVMELEGDTTEERPSRCLDDDDDEESSIGHDSEGYSIPPMRLDTLDEADETPPATRDISRLSQPEIREATVEVQVEPTPPPITDVAEEIGSGASEASESVHGPESEFGVRPQGTPYFGQQMSHDSSDDEDSSGSDAEAEPSTPCSDCDADGEDSFHDPDGSLEIMGEPDTCEQSMVGDSTEVAAATTEDMPAYGHDAVDMEVYTEGDSGSIEESSSLGTESSSKRRGDADDDDPSTNSGPAKT